MASRDIKDLFSEMQPLVKTFIEKGIVLLKPWIPFLTSTYRSFKEQNDLYAQGRTKSGKIVTNAKGGESFHNSRRAVDIAFKDRNGKVSWDPNLYRQLATRKVEKLEWGGLWKSFPDFPHWQYTFCSKHKINHLNPRNFKEDGTCKL